MNASALDLLSGDAQTFLEKVWASRVHLHRTDPEELVGLLQRGHELGEVERGQLAEVGHDGGGQDDR